MSSGVSREGRGHGSDDEVGGGAGSRMLGVVRCAGAGKGREDRLSALGGERRGIGTFEGTACRGNEGGAAVAGV